MTLGKSHIIHKISASNGLPKRTAGLLLESLLEIIKHTLASGGPVMISGFGKFQVKDKRTRRGRNPQTGNALVLDARRIVTFKCSDVLKRRINHPWKPPKKN